MAGIISQSATTSQDCRCEFKESKPRRPIRHPGMLSLLQGPSATFIDDPVCSDTQVEGVSRVCTEVLESEKSVENAESGRQRTSARLGLHEMTVDATFSAQTVYEHHKHKRLCTWKGI